jgi:hypothetical protein
MLMNYRLLKEGIEGVAVVMAAFIAFMLLVNILLYGVEAAWQWLFSTLQSLRA